MRRDRIAADMPIRAQEAIGAVGKLDDPIKPFRPYARMLAGRYWATKSGVDQDDVEQTALVAAWEAIRYWEDTRPPNVSKVACVQARMRWRVLDLVEPQNNTERQDIQRLSYETLMEDRD